MCKLYEFMVIYVKEVMWVVLVCSVRPHLFILAAKMLFSGSSP